MCNAAAITSIVCTVPGARLLSDVGAELSFQLPMQESASFPGMLAKLDDALPRAGFLSYGIGVTTMEEVFLKVRTLPTMSLGKLGRPRFETHVCVKPVSQVASIGEEEVEQAGGSHHSEAVVSKDAVTVNVPPTKAPAHDGEVSIEAVRKVRVLLLAVAAPRLPYLVNFPVV